MAPGHLRVLYLHQYFMTRAGVGGTRSYEFARFLARKGHQVTMVTAAPAGERGTGTARRRHIDGIDVLTVGVGYSDYVAGTKRGYARRLLSFAAFALAATLAVVRLPRPDVVLATSPPLTIALPGIAASRRHRTPLVFEARDLWPEAPIQMGALRNPLLARLARALERYVYRASARVVALSPGIRDGVLAAGADPERVVTIPNASDLDLFSPDADGSDVRARLGLEDRFVCSYFGTMGEANDLTQVIEAAALLRERREDGIAFVLCGDGKRRAELEALSRRLGLSNVIFSDPVPRSAVPSLAAASDACMTIFKDVPILSTCSPNKLFDTLAAGRPALVNTPGWLRQLVEENDAGVFVRPGDAGHLAERVSHLRDHPELVAAYGANARRLAERCFDRELLADRLLGVLSEAAATR